MDCDAAAHDRLTVGRMAPKVSSENWSGFVRRQWSGHDDSSKHQQRIDAAKFILSKNIKSMRLGSLPGCAWEFESYVLDERGWSSGDIVVGVEKNGVVFEKSASRIPGFGRNHLERFDLKSGRFEAQCRSGQHRLVHADLLSLLSVRRDDVNGDEAYLQFHNATRRWNAAWWDFTSCLCPSVVACLSLTMQNLDLRCNCCPVVVTVAVGRETSVTRDAIAEMPGDACEKRVEVIRKSLKVDGPRSVSVSGYDVYRSDGGVSILQVRLTSRIRPPYLIEQGIWKQPKKSTEKTN